VAHATISSNAGGSEGTIELGAGIVFVTIESSV
jgi:hypothetical protein